ncbi:hypothetical protein [Echinicola shivajiensis]|uniref:hypothetical protein n=1 Tax=Echinicola shivajiensis TaxID=1035916 RepID=UPI001BFC1F8C|nr:hypothetical protein [Echinicola shivajiensis]
MKVVFNYSRVIGQLCLVLFLLSCTDEKDETPDRATEETVRLKHFADANQVNEAVLPLINGYELGSDDSFTDTGNYPKLPYIYYYTVRWEKEVSSLASINLSVSGDTGIGDETKEEILEYSEGMVEVNDPRIGKAPYANVFVIRNEDNSKLDWRYELYMDLGTLNEDNHRITLTGVFIGPDSQIDQAPNPPSDAEAISIMLELVEGIKTDD